MIRPHTQRFPQVRADGQQLQHTPVSRLQIRAQNQTGHQLPLREIMPAPRRTIIGQMLAAQPHRQFGLTFHRRFLPSFLAHPFSDAPDIKWFLQNNTLYKKLDA
jgi:hypothetical protein